MRILGEDEDDDDDPVNSGNSAKPLSQCEASTTLLDQSNCPDVRKSKIAYEASTMESDTGKEVDKSHVNQTIGLTSRLWAAAKSFLVNEYIAMTGYANSTEIGPLNVSSSGTLSRKELSSVSPIIEHTIPLVVVTPADHLYDAMLSI